MVEFNLLPDVKVQHLKAKRLEYLVITASFIVGAASILVFILLFVFVDVGQKVRIDDLNNNITTTTAQLKSNKSLNQILTVQNQLKTIPSLENQSPTASRLFGYLSQLTPLTATISTLDVSYTANNIVITGGADSLNTVNTFVDTLKYATYNNATIKTNGVEAFSAVVLTSFAYNSSTTGVTSNTIYNFI
ncbi:MAG: hypothetical protein WDN66_01985 [Candidatus Saccharibacteria bacterium]